VHGIHAANFKVENSAQGLSCRLKFVHALSIKVLIANLSMTHLLHTAIILSVVFFTVMVRVIMLSGIGLSIVMLSVLAPTQQLLKKINTHFEF
jgi:hypothetical protein